ncbi:hypothetical protein PAXINDRAFT_16012 [Paxillus involutus ATCC 200175]|jgi:hypothetical protein|uniref:Uncharacterized protein n=1 Tax=Paxillus involutus ATCC 200175 TaxID=664439 RepID=A0A0C9T5R0_PAXIN|nr:hypothetical protein PAXINDRAFT_16012 [Paxillus involutus ATCC 200175]
MGTKGVSSNESNESATRRNKSRTFDRVTPTWRSSQLMVFMWRLDEVVERMKGPEFGKRKKAGNQMRNRIPSDKTNPEAVAPKGLPKNCYNEDWLAGLYRSQREMLNIRDKDYEFGIEDERDGAYLAGDEEEGEHMED